MNEELIWPTVIDLAQPSRLLLPVENHQVRKAIAPETLVIGPIQVPEVPVNSPVAHNRYSGYCSIRDHYPACNSDNDGSYPSHSPNHSNAHWSRHQFVHQSSGLPIKYRTGEVWKRWFRAFYKCKHPSFMVWNTNIDLLTIVSFQSVW